VDLGRVYRDKVANLTEAFEDEALRAQAFERIRALIDAVVLTPENGELAIHLRGKLASMLELCAGPQTPTSSASIPWRRCKLSWLRGQDLNL
jgi:site-specific DNA recombinase